MLGRLHNQPKVIQLVGDSTSPCLQVPQTRIPVLTMFYHHLQPRHHTVQTLYSPTYLTNNL